MSLSFYFSKKKRCRITSWVRFILATATRNWPKLALESRMWLELANCHSEAISGDYNKDLSFLLLSNEIVL